MTYLYIHLAIAALCMFAIMLRQLFTPYFERRPSFWAWTFVGVIVWEVTAAILLADMFMTGDAYSENTHG